MSEPEGKRRRTNSGPASADGSTAVTVKKEGGGAAAMDPQDKMVLECCNEARSAKFIMDQVGLDSKLLMESVNRLVAAGKLAMQQSTEGKMLKFVRKDEGRVKVEAKMESYEERLVYQQIEDSKNRGIWVKNLREQTGLEANDIKRLLRKMEVKKLIKKVSSVTAPKKPMYMVFDAVPDVSLTGGAWYSGAEFNREFIRGLSDFVVQLAQKKLEKAAADFAERPRGRLNAASFTAAQIMEDINGSEAFREPLSEENITDILNLLIWDWKITLVNDARAAENAPKRYKASPEVKTIDGCLVAPCGVCHGEDISDTIDNPDAVSPFVCAAFANW